MANEFTSIPILEYGDAISPSSKPEFLAALRHALVNVGFFYIRNHGMYTHCLFIEDNC